MEKISDKLLNIVNDFHNSSINNIKKERKSIGGIRTKSKKNKNSNKKLIIEGKKKKPKKKSIIKMK